MKNLLLAVKMSGTEIRVKYPVDTTPLINPQAERSTARPVAGAIRFFDLLMSTHRYHIPLWSLMPWYVPRLDALLTARWRILSPAKR